MLFLLGVKELGSKGVKTLVFLFIPLPSERSGGGCPFIHSPPLGEAGRGFGEIGRGLAYTHEKGTRPSTEERPEYNVDFETLS